MHGYTRDEEPLPSVDYALLFKRMWCRTGTLMCMGQALGRYAFDPHLCSGFEQCVQVRWSSGCVALPRLLWMSSHQ